VAFSTWFLPVDAKRRRRFQNNGVSALFPRRGQTPQILEQIMAGTAAMLANEFGRLLKDW
jgi:hypothetical protein